MGASLEHPEKVRHLIHMLLGIFAAQGVLALGEKPIHSVGDLLTQHLDLLEAEADDKGGVSQVLRGCDVCPGCPSRAEGHRLEEFSPRPTGPGNHDLCGSARHAPLARGCGQTATRAGKSASLATVTPPIEAYLVLHIVF
jgi:hypothetical protein